MCTLGCVVKKPRIFECSVMRMQHIYILIYFSLSNKRVDQITVLPRAIFKKLNCPRLNNCLSYDTFHFFKRGIIKLSSWTINKYEM